MKLLTLTLSPLTRKTDLYIQRELLETDLLEKLTLGKKKVIIAPVALKQKAAFLAKKLKGSYLTIPNGEKAKTSSVQQKLEKALFKAGCGKDTVLLALGGGTTTDLVGFVASIYMRGISLILIPSTLLAMVDAAIGGKTGLDLPFGKNLIGSFYHPQAIVVDLDLLKTLPQVEWFNGYAEILKMGLIFDSSLLKMPLKEDATIEKAIQCKMHVIAQDPDERIGYRHILNFGHTVGHALEALSSYRLSHGMAVAIGTLVESHLSFSLGFLKKEDFEAICFLYSIFSLKLPKGYSRKKLLKYMLHDKKNQEGKLRIVLLDRLGHALESKGCYAHEVAFKDLIPSLSWMEETYG